MQFKELEWKDIISDRVTVCSHCEINLCGVIKMEFKINHESKEDQYLLYCFGKGRVRRLQHEKYDSIERAKIQDTVFIPHCYFSTVCQNYFITSDLYLSKQK